MFKSVCLCLFVCVCGEFICCLAPTIKTMMLNYQRLLQRFVCQILYVPDLAKNKLFQESLFDKMRKLLLYCC